MSSEPPRRVWFALLAPPAAWFVALVAAYFMVSWACGSAAGRVTLHVTLLSMLALAIAGGVAGLGLVRRRSRPAPGASARPEARTAFLAVLGTFGSVVFGVAILWFWLAAAVLDPCEPGPRLPFSPSAMAGERALPGA